MRKFGLIGYPLGHSFSQKYFTAKFEREEIENCSYELFPLENIDDVRLLFEINKNLLGLNVTIPYKEQIIDYLDELDVTASRIGAVNCIKIEDPEFTRIKKGYNTDCLGFRDALQPHLQKHHTKALVLGTGGSAKAISYALEELHIEHRFVSRQLGNTHLHYTDIDKTILDTYPVVINCTPLGMFPDTDKEPAIPFRYLTPYHLCFDLVYNPQETKFLQLAKDHGALAVGGYAMLCNQAEYAWKIWNEE